MATVFDQANQNLTGAGEVYGDISNGGAAVDSMNQYMNPYQQQVIDRTMGTMRDQYGINMRGIGDQADASSAYGGGRHGLVESDMANNWMRQAGDMTAGMNQQGFNTAMNAGFQDVNQQLSGAQGMQNLGMNQFGIGQSINNQQMQQGNQQQQLAQSVLDMANNDFQSYMGNPMNSVQNQMAAMQGNPLMGNQMSTSKPGLLDYLGLGAQMVGKVGSGGK